jgi:1,4-alpha-glucan branching enzyme
MREENIKKRVVFRLNDTGAREVFLAGSFNAWDPSELPLRKDGRGAWKTTVTLESGIYQYRFVVDGEWKKDPSSPDARIDGSLACHSVLVV